MRLFLIIIAGILFSRCAQVGFLSGGDKDIFAPVPVATPSNGQTNFNGSSIQFTFNEYVTLNNPKETIFMVPEVKSLDAELKKKTLTVRWNEELLPNTTYTLYLNNAVKDLHEGNDSLMTYVFSTGSVIDSLSYNVPVVDGWTNQPLKNILVGLYTDESAGTPLYFSRSDQNGEVILRNLRSENYFVRAFPDEDKDRKMNRSEMRGFRSDLLKLDSSWIDTVPIRLSLPDDQSVRSVSVIGPGLISVGASFSLENTTFSTPQIARLNYRSINSDSLLISFCPDTLQRTSLYINHPRGIDTVQISYPKKEKERNLIWSSESFKRGIIQDQPIILDLNDQIDGFDERAFQLLNPADSSELPIKKVFTEFNRLYIEFEGGKLKNLKLKIVEGAVKGLCGKSSEALEQIIAVKQAKELGTLLLNVKGEDQAVVIELLSGNSVVDRKIGRSSDLHRFEMLDPQDYSFRIILDSNENGRWDRVDESSGRQPESVLYYSTPVKVRANWETEVELDLEE